MPSLATGAECIAKGLLYDFLPRDVSTEKQSKFLPHFIFNLHKDRPKSLSSALIIGLMTSPRMPQITVSNQIKILSPPWKHGARMPLVIRVPSRSTPKTAPVTLIQGSVAGLEERDGKRL